MGVNRNSEHIPRRFCLTVVLRGLERSGNPALRCSGEASIAGGQIYSKHRRFDAKLKTIRFVKQVPLWIIRGYQWILSPVLGPACRFYPSCSDYAHEAIRQHGVLAGSVLALKRVCRCHPWHPGGVDPVPHRSNPKITAGDAVDRVIRQ
ncbi:MAG: membrane protein insertion efficiency factor YidD [Deltaproteobacteria bacterium]|nr:membrane protein insertion efficiency factor YidD [Deltaproteobacteria bacterium]MBW1954700.1 membrane protein insertion efficiency factor YidD [Deltaproteobacteria bacterium]MBW2040551.1 membrane protein insertion efficiency factor YidD [Deltaproteobacteria bacterium]MBW2131418.1 membrane protein insertion efficiency factor YidD [Deltaproteobacteria bacterium]